MISKAAGTPHADAFQSSLRNVTPSGNSTGLIRAWNGGTAATARAPSESRTPTASPVASAASTDVTQYLPTSWVSTHTDSSSNTAVNDSRSGQAARTSVALSAASGETP